MAVFGKLFVRRIGTHDAPRPTGPSDLEALSVSLSQTQGEAATVDVECLYPATGLLSGPRWAVVSVDVDGVEQELARGELVGHPVSFPGERVTVELLCRKPDFKAEVSALFAQYDGFLPVEYEPLDRDRRTEPFLPWHVHVDPVTLNAELVPYGGASAPSRTLYGEGSAQSDVLSMALAVTKTPASAVRVRVEAEFVEERVQLVDLWDPTGNVDTLTPNALRAAVQNLNVDGPGLQILASELELAHIAEQVVRVQDGEVDPTTCLKTPNVTATVDTHRVTDGRISALARAEQPRREVLTLTLVPQQQDLGGSELVEDVLVLGPLEERMRKTVVTQYFNGDGNLRAITARAAPRDSLFVKRSEPVVGQLWDPNVRVFDAEFADDLVQAAFYRAVKIALERAHCVELDLEVPASAAFGLSVRDRVAVADARFTTGLAVGKVKSISLTFGGSETARLVLECPISSPSSWREAGGWNFTYPYDLQDSTVAPALPPVMAAMRSNLSLKPFLVENFEVIDGAVEQLAALAPHLETAAEPVPTGGSDPLTLVPQTRVEVTLAPMDPVPPEELAAYEPVLQPGVLFMQRGVVLS